MRKLVSLFSVLVVVVALSACGDDDDKSDSGSGGESTAQNTTIEPVKANTLTVTTSLPAPGFWNGEDPASIDGGFEYEMGQEIAKRLGLDDVEVTNVSWDALIAGQAKDFDVALSQITIYPDRREVLDFTTPYFSSDQGVLVKKGTTVDTLADAKKLKWGVQGSTTGQDFLEDEVEPESEAAVFQDTPSMFTALQANQVEAVMLDTAIVLGQASESNGELEVVAQFKTGEEYGGALTKGSKNLDVISGAIEQMKVDGTIDALVAKWLVPVFKGDPSQIPVIPV